jgi:aspartate beta-hydroxylase
LLKRLANLLGLKVADGASIRVGGEERSWQEGKVMVFDDSFEHEVWHNGTGFLLVLIVDLWHPDLTEHQRMQLSPI